MKASSHSALAALIAITVAACAATDSGEEDPVGSTSEALEIDKASFGQIGHVVNGALLFTNPVPGTDGNGRACSTCHVPTTGFALTPANAEARWQALQTAKKKNKKADDPLFRSIDADDFGSNFTMVRKWGLTRVEIPMHPNVRLVDKPGVRTVKIFRSTPSIFNVAITAPYQWDARFPTLQAQANGALHDHAQIKHEPRPGQLDDLASFEKVIFPSKHAYDVAQAVQAGTAVPPDAPVTGDAVRGKEIFERACTTCHGGPSFNQSAFGTNLFGTLVTRPLPPFAIESEFPEAPPLEIQNFAFKQPDGSEVFYSTTDPGLAIETGEMFDLEAFKTPALRGLSKTAPYFHDNSAKTLRDVAKHYQGMFRAFDRIDFPFGVINDDEIDPLAAYLGTL